MARSIVYEPFKTVPISDFKTELEFEFSELQPSMLEFYLVKTAVDMAEKGNLIRRHIAIELEPGVSRYLLETPDDLKFHAVLGARLGDCCGSWEVTRSFTPPNGCRCLGHGTVWLTPEEQTLHFSSCHCGVLYVSMSVKPERKACELPKEYQEDLYPTLIMGTRASLMLLTGRKWTNIRVGAELLNEYNRMITRNAVAVAQRGQRGSVKMTFGRVM